MSDHWNSLANLLGTPSLKPHGKRGAVEEVQPVAEALTSGESLPVVESKATTSKSAKGSSKEEASKSKRSPRRGKKSDAIEGFAEEVIVEQEPVVSVDSGDLVPVRDVNEIQSVENSKLFSNDEQSGKPVSVLRSSWDAVANFFGMGGSENPEPRSERSQDTRRSSGTPRGRRAGRSEDRDLGEVQKDKGLVEPEGRSVQGVDSVDVPVDRRGERRPPRRGAQGAGQVQSENIAKGDVARDGSRDRRAGRVDQVGKSERVQRVDDDSLERDDRRLERDDRRPERDDRRPERNDRRQDRDDRRLERNDRVLERGDRKPERSERRSQRDDRKPDREPRQAERGFGGGLDDFEAPSREDSSFAEGFDKGVDLGRPERSEDRGESRKMRGGRRDQDRDRVVDGERRRRSDSRNDSHSEPRGSDDLDSFGGSSVEGDDREETRVRAGRIPSWEETVAVLIEANVANHRKTPSGPNRSRRGRPSS